jgi:hypothetical protein
MNVIRHYHITYDHEAIALPDFLEHGKKKIAPPRTRQPRLAMITTASDEVQLIGAVITPGMVGHKASLLVCAKKNLGRLTAPFPPLQRT